MTDFACIQVKHLPIENLFRRANVPNPVQKFLPIIAAGITFKSLIVNYKTLDDVFFQTLRRPNAELSAAFALDTIADGDDYVEIVKLYLVGFSISAVVAFFATTEL